MSFYDSMILSTYFLCVEGLCLEAVDVDVIFRSPSKQTMNITNFLVWEITFLHYFIVMRDTALVESVSGILYSFFTKVIMTL